MCVKLLYYNMVYCTTVDLHILLCYIAYCVFVYTCIRVTICYMVLEFYIHVTIYVQELPIESSIVEVDPFPGAVCVTSNGSYEGPLLLNKKTMFLLKEKKILSALKLLLFKV